MTAGITALQHINVTVTPEMEAATKSFYGTVLGLREVPKPEGSRGRGGAWYQLGSVQLHLSREVGVTNEGARRHFCLLVSDLQSCRSHLERSGIEIRPDTQPIEGWKRFYVRDPGGNLIEIAQDTTDNS